jgi:hypothetical protein
MCKKEKRKREKKEMDAVGSELCYPVSRRFLCIRGLRNAEPQQDIRAMTGFSRNHRFLATPKAYLPK